jgi:hypothetical protein
MRIFEVISKPIKENASAGATSAGAIASVPATGAGSKVGTLFGGTYKQKKTKRTK